MRESAQSSAMSVVQTGAAPPALGELARSIGVSGEVARELGFADVEKRIRIAVGDEAGAEDADTNHRSSICLGTRSPIALPPRRPGAYQSLSEDTTGDN